MPRRRIVCGAAIGLGCVLLLAGAVEAQRESAVGTTARSIQAAIDVRANLGSLAAPGQSTGFAVAGDGTLGVVDRTHEQVLHLDANGGLIAQWGPRFEADADAEDLSGLAQSDNNWYVLDRGRQRIEQLDDNGRFVRAIDLRPLATYGPNGLATDTRGGLYLADTGGNRVLAFNSNGSYVRSIGTAGDGLGQLKQPMNVGFATDGSMFVTDFENSRVERWSPDLRTTIAWQLPEHAWGIAVDAAGRVFVPDAEQHLLRVYGPDGDPLGEVDGLPLEFPTQVGLSPDGSALWVLGNNGLARMDTSSFAQIVPTRRSTGSPTPLLIIVGTVLTLLGAAAFVVPGGVVRRSPSRSVPNAVEAEPQPGQTRPVSRTYGAALAFVGLGVAGAAFAQFALSTPSGRADPWPRLALLVMSGVVWATGAVLSARGLPFQWIGAWHSGARQATIGRQRIVIGVLACVMASIAAVLWWTGHFETTEATRAAFVWLLAVGAAVLACAGGSLGRPSRMALLPFVLFVVALVPRIWQVADLPYGVWYDEASGAVEIRRVVQMGTYTPILNTYGKDTSGFFYVMPGLWPLLGDTLLAARSAAALVGALTVPAVYFLGRELFGWRVGLSAGLILAFMRWHVNFSRLAFNPISLPLCATLTLWLLARGIRRKSWPDMMWAGLALGLGLHAYTGFRGMPVVAGFVLVYAALRERWPVAAFARRFGLYLGGAVLLALPVLIFALLDPVTFNGRTAQTLIMTQPVPESEKAREILDSLQRHLLMFQVSGDMNGRHNLPGAPMLDTLTGGLVMLGLGWLVIRPFNWRNVMLLAWSAVCLSGGILTLAFEAPQAVRTFGITPVLAVLAAVGLIGTLDRTYAALTQIRVVRPWRARVALAAASTVTLATIAATNMDTFFNRQMRNPDVFAAFSTRETAPARFALQDPRDYEAILASTTMAPSVQADFLVPDQRALIRGFDPAADLPYRGHGPALILLETEHDRIMADEVARAYPDATRVPIQAPSGTTGPIVDGFVLSPRVLAAAHAEGASQAILAIDVTADYAFRGAFTVDGLALSGTTRVHLARGSHALAITGVAQWQPPGAPDWEPLPTQALFASDGRGTGLVATVSSDAGQEEYVDPVVAHYYHVTPFSRLGINPQQWTIEWNGSLSIDAPGAYGFALDHSQQASLFIDDQPVDSLVQLTPGLHAIRMRFEKTSDESPYINLLWTPPRRPQSVVPGSVLYPPAPQVLAP